MGKLSPEDNTLRARLRHKHEWWGAAWSSGQAKGKWYQEMEWGWGQRKCAQGTPSPSRVTEDAARGFHPRLFLGEHQHWDVPLAHISHWDVLVWSQKFMFKGLVLALGTRWGWGGGGNGEGGTRRHPLVPLFSCLGLKSLCFSFSQLGFSHPRPSSHYRWNSPDWCERVFCQVSKIRLHHYPPRWHVSSFVGLHLLRTEAAKRQMVLLAWNHVPPPGGLGGRPTRPNL